MIGHRKLISMILKRDEVAILQTGKNMSSVLFLNEHEEARVQLVDLIYGEIHDIAVYVKCLYSVGTW